MLNAVRCAVRFGVAVNPEFHTTIELSELDACWTVKNRCASNLCDEGEYHAVFAGKRADFGSEPSGVSDAGNHTPDALAYGFGVETFDLNLWCGKCLVHREPGVLLDRGVQV
jgi:hypothetical protein